MTKDIKAAFDLSSLDTEAACSKPFEFEVLHPANSTPTGIFISVVGIDSTQYQSLIRKFANENIRNTGANSLETLERKNLDALVAATTGWRSPAGAGKVMLSGDVLEFSADNVRLIYKKLPRVAAQVSEAINNLGNFMPE